MIILSTMLTYFYGLLGIDQLQQQSHELSFISTTEYITQFMANGCLLKRNQ